LEEFWAPLSVAPSACRVAELARKSLIERACGSTLPFTAQTLVLGLLARWLNLRAIRLAGLIGPRSARAAPFSLSVDELRTTR
jgi:hypothetical protein